MLIVVIIIIIIIIIIRIVIITTITNTKDCEAGCGSCLFRRSVKDHTSTVIKELGTISMWESTKLSCGPTANWLSRQCSPDICIVTNITHLEENVFIWTLDRQWQIIDIRPTVISTTAHNIVNSVNNKLKRSLHSKNIHMTSPPAFITEGLEGGGLNVFIRKFRGVNSLIVPPPPPPPPPSSPSTWIMTGPLNRWVTSKKRRPRGRGRVSYR